jgi:DNA-binding transcriptional MerR regulator
VKISELSERSGLSIATVKYYIRERLVPPGERAARNQAAYSEAHLERLKIVRALREDAGLSVREIGRVIGAMETGRDDVRRGDAGSDDPASLPASTGDRGSPAYRAAWATVQGIARDMGWLVDERDVLAGDLIQALLTVQKAWPFDTPGGQILRYARAVKEIARFELPENWDPAGAPAASIQYAVLGTYLFEPLLLAMRRLAHRERAREVRAAQARRGESA